MIAGLFWNRPEKKKQVVRPVLIRDSGTRERSNARGRSVAPMNCSSICRNSNASGHNTGLLHRDVKRREEAWEVQ